jgi:hypothetical protein
MIDLDPFLLISEAEKGQFPFEHIRKLLGSDIIMGKDNKCLDLNDMNVHNMNNYELTITEKEIATTLINDGWYGTYDELLQCVRELNK